MLKLFQRSLSREIVLYLVIGVLTTGVDYLVFWLVNEPLKAAVSPTQAALWATAAGWAAAVLFAFVTNKLIVFRSRDLTRRTVLREAASFFAARAASGLIVLFLMWLLVDRLRFNEYYSKILTSVFNIVFNYAASKLFIFRQ